MKSKWQQIQNILRQTISPALFQVWIPHLSAECNGETLCLLATNDFVADWVRQRLLQPITEAATTVLGFRPVVEVQSATKKAAESKPSPLTMPLAVEQSKPESGQLGLPLQVCNASLNCHSWRFTFDDFVVGPCNELAYAAAKGICNTNMPAEQLYVTSAPGLGKTHLLQAVGSFLHSMSNRNELRVEYLTAEEFARRMIFALRSNEIERFKAKYRDSVDILLLEDIHFFQGKQKIQDELLATLKALRSNGSRLVFSSSLLPRELKDLDSQLASRISSGLLAVIDKPDFETRKRILENKARRFHAVLSEGVADLLAESLSSDIRQLESCLHNLILKAKILNRTITQDMALQVLQHYNNIMPNLTMEGIVKLICKNYDLSEDQLRSKSRQRQIVLARNTAFFLARKHTDLSLKDIGTKFNRKHSTVIKGITNIERELSLKTPLGCQLSKTMDLIERSSSSANSSE